MKFNFKISWMAFLVMLFAAAPSFAIQTPTSKTAYRFEPDGLLADSGEEFWFACITNGYTVTTNFSIDPPGVTYPSVNLLSLTDNLGSGYGAMLVTAHGSAEGFMAEVYSSEGEDARNASFEAYTKSTFVKGVDIYKSFNQDTGVHGISITASKVGSLFSAANSIVHVMVCHGRAFQATAWPGAYLKLGYSGSPTSYSYEADAFWKHMGTGAPASTAPMGTIEHDGGLDIALKAEVIQAARVSGFAVLSGVAEWSVASEYNTSGYAIEASSTLNGPWSTLVPGISSGAGQRVVSVPSASYYRLVEQEVGGKKIIHAFSKPEQTPVQVQAPVVAQVSTLHAMMTSAATSKSQTLLGVGEKLVAFSPQSLASEVQRSILDYWQYWRGYDVELVNTSSFPSDPDSFRTALKAEIAQRAILGTKYFLLVGDANDWKEFGGALWTSSNGWDGIRQGYLASGYPVGGQRERDLIPTFYIPDNSEPPDKNVGFFTPYIPSDLPYADTNDDGVRDVVLTRLPFTTVEEVASYGLNMQTADAGAYGFSQACFLKGDIDHDGVGNGWFAKAAADSVEAYLVGAGYTTLSLLESSVPLNSARNTQTADIWNQQRPEMFVILSGYSNRSWPGNFFDQTNPVNPWQMQMLYGYANHFPLVLAASCGGADFSRTEDPDYGMPICERMLSTPGVGAGTWIGPTAGSDYRANREISKYIVQEVSGVPDRSIAESFLVAMQRVRQDFVGDSQVLDTAGSYVVLGDPLSRIHVLMVPAGVEDGGMNRRKVSAYNYPNPFNPHTTIRFSTVMDSRVRLTVYDVQGHLVRTLLNRNMASGQYTVSWNAKDESGHNVSSGTYFYKLEAGKRVVTRKMILVR